MIILDLFVAKRLIAAYFIYLKFSTKISQTSTTSLPGGGGLNHGRDCREFPMLVEAAAAAVELVVSVTMLV